MESQCLSPVKRKPTTTLVAATPPKRSRLTRPDWFNDLKTTSWIDGEVTCLPPRNYICACEGFPVWLPALDVANINSVWFPLTLPILGIPVLRDAANLQLVRLQALITETPPSSESTLLVSGSFTFIHRILHHFPMLPALYCLDHHCRGRSLPVGSLPFKRLKHHKVGGGTSFMLLWGSRGIGDFAIPFSHSRSIGSFIDHSVRGFTASPTTAGCCHWTKFLAPQYLHTPVLFPSDWSSTGFASRPLTHKELSQVLGFTEEHPFASADLLPLLHSSLIPIDPLRVVLRAYLASLGSTPLVRPSGGPAIWTPSPPPTGIYLPDLDTILPTSWRSLATDEDKRTSAKADDARPDISMWNQRITLVLPHILPWALDWLRLRLVRRRAVRLRVEVLRMLRLYHPRQYLGSLRRTSAFYLGMLQRAESRFLETAGGG